MTNKISIIIPVFNRAKYIERCLDSILNQTYSNFEIILINDGSTDNSLDILKKYKKQDKRIIIIDKKHEGVSIARNAGIKKSSGDYITFVDSDDYLELNALENMINLSKKYKCEIIRTDYRYLNYNKDLPHTHKYEGMYKLNNKNRHMFIESALKEEFGCYIWLLLIKKDFIIKNNIYFEKELYVHQDLDFYINLFNNAHSIYFSNIITYNYIFNKECSKNLKNTKRNVISNINLSKALYSKLDNSYNDLIDVLTTKLSYIYFMGLFIENKMQLKEIYYMLINNEDFSNILKRMYSTKAYKKYCHKHKVYYFFLLKKINFNFLAFILNIYKIFFNKK